MKRILFALMMLSGVTTFAQSDYDVSKDKENGAVVFKGQCSFADLKKETSFSWLDKGAAMYAVDSDAVVYLKKNLPQYEMVVLLGTWCDDSQTLIPKLYKTLQATNYPIGKVTMYGVDRAKEAKYVEHKLYKLKKVPTIILIKNNMEIGRIEELVKKSIETDLIAIIQKDIESKQTH